MVKWNYALDHLLIYPTQCRQESDHFTFYLKSKCLLKIKSISHQQRWKGRSKGASGWCMMCKTDQSPLYQAISPAMHRLLLNNSGISWDLHDDMITRDLFVSIHDRLYSVLTACHAFKFECTGYMALFNILYIYNYVLSQASCWCASVVLLLNISHV